MRWCWSEHGTHSSVLGDFQTLLDPRRFRLACERPAKCSMAGLYEAYKVQSQSDEQSRRPYCEDGETCEAAEAERNWYVRHGNVWWANKPQIDFPQRVGCQKLHCRFIEVVWARPRTNASISLPTQDIRWSDAEREYFIWLRTVGRRARFDEHHSVVVPATRNNGKKRKADTGEDRSAEKIKNIPKEVKNHLSISNLSQRWWRNKRN